MNRQQRINKRPGFTLVEMLVVITIIGILAGMIVAGVLPALTAAKRAQIVLDIAEIEKALILYKTTYGAYPPDLSGFNVQEKKLRIQQHLSRNFPRRKQTLDQPTIDFTRLDPSEALVFWLSGFSKDPQRPLSGGGERTPMTEFDKTSLVDFDGDGFMSYVPKSAPNAPYVYFNAKTYADSSGNPRMCDPANSGNIAKPMLIDQPNPAGEIFVKEDSFQIISAGLDEKYGGTAPLSFTNGGVPYPEEARDNLTNFSDGTLEDAQEQ